MPQLSRNNLLILVAILALLYQTGKLPGIPTTRTNEIDFVTYVYEKDDGGIPVGVMAGLMKLNETGVVATEFEDDTVDGDGQVPDQYKLALSSAAGSEPCLVVQSGDRVVRVVKVSKDTTVEQIMEAVK